MPQVHERAIAEPGAAPPEIFVYASSRKTGLRRYIGPKRAILLLAAIGMVAVAWHLRRTGQLQPEVLRGFMEHSPVLALVGFVGIYAVSTATLMPTLPFNLAAGVLWGPVAGGAIAAFSAFLGAVISFQLARALLGPRVLRRFAPGFVQWLQAEVERAGWRFVAFVRLNPVFPTGPLNCVLGLTSISLWSYSWATFVFLLPPSIAMAWIGSTAGTFVVNPDIAGIVRSVLLISGAVTLLFGLKWGARYFTRGRAAKRARIAVVAADSSVGEG